MSVRWLAFSLGVAFLWAAACFDAAGGEEAAVPNGGFEKVMSGGKGPEGWTIGIAPNTKATIQVDGTIAHSGRYSVRIADQSPTQPFVYAVIHSPKFTVQPERTYDIRFFAKARNTTGCSVGADLDAGDVCRENLPKEGVLGRYSRGLTSINYFIADCGSGNRVPIPSDACAYVLDDKAVFHTLNQYRIWSANENMSLWATDRENARTLEEVLRLLPKQRPAVLSIVGTSSDLLT
jgi:hypothetical protein